MRKLLLWTLALALHAPDAAGQSPETTVSAQVTVSDGDHTPLWLNANRYGLSSLDKVNSYLRASVTQPMTAFDSTSHWSYSYGVDMALTQGFTSNVVLQQAYAEAKWRSLTISLGSKERPMELKDNELSTGSQTYGKNSRPIPQLRVGINDYVPVPGMSKWLSAKLFIAYGLTTDNKWQRDFAAPKAKYTQDTWFHHKAGYLRFGATDHTPMFSFELGLEMITQYGGTSYNLTNRDKLENEGGLLGAWHAFIPSGSDATETFYKNVSGNHLGSWVARLNYDTQDYTFSIYYDHFFEDHSGLFFLDYNGYGEGDRWDKKVDWRFLLYGMKDMMIGLNLKMKRPGIVDNIVLEHLYTKYQSGSVYHDHTLNISTHIGGMDEYYNHHIFTGPQHWGQVMGNPLYTSPIYNDDGQIMVKNNRFYAMHLGIAGHPASRIGYRILGTYEKGFGTYRNPFANPKETISALAEATVRLNRKPTNGEWLLTAAFGADKGQLFGNNYGGQVTLTRTFKN